MTDGVQCVCDRFWRVNNVIGNMTTILFFSLWWRAAAAAAATFVLYHRQRW